MFWQIMILLVLLIPLLAIVLDSRVGEALAARLERGSPRADAERIAQRIQMLESEVERLTTEVEHLEEESDFLHKLLADRHPSGESSERTLPSGRGGGALSAGGEGGSRATDEEGASHATDEEGPTRPSRRDESTLPSGDEGG